MRVVGLTGGIACGKTTVAGWLKELGAAVIDADAISRGLTAPGGAALPAIFGAFGRDVENGDGTLNRGALAAKVFENEALRQRLNGIVHPMVLARIREEMEKCREAGVSVVVLDVPLLYEAGMEGLADAVLCVAAPEAVQLSRLQARDGLTREQALARIHSQWPLEKKIRLADETLWTDGPVEKVRARAEEVFKRLRERSPR